jgi:hypothetical protein
MSYVIPDIQPFRSNDGAQINGRRQWREHLKATGLEEFGVSDLSAAQQAAEKRRREAIAKIEKLQKEVIGKWEEPTPLPESEPDKNRLWCKVAERLDGRDKPTRKQLIRVVVEEMRRK